MKRMKTLTSLLLIFILCFATVGCNKEEGTAKENKVVRLSTTTSVNDSGLLPYLQDSFEEETGYQLEITSAGTGAAIEKGTTGDADCLLVHAKASEEEFINSGYGVERVVLMYNYFVIVGPQDDPAGVAECKTASEAFEKIAETFLNTTPNNVYQIHGHRNTKGIPIQVNDRVFNLEGRVEFGGVLRCVQVDVDGIHTFEIQNKVFKTPEMREEQTITKSSIADTIIALRANRYIQEKKFDNISSFNFTKQAFYDKVWDEQTVKARGLYIDTVKGKVVARSYEKFWNINERPETKFDMLQNKLQFPITAYVKENGFLGIVSYDEYNDDLFVASKSTIDSEFAQWFKDMLYEKVSSDNLMKMKEFIKENNVSFVFECVDMKNDPHIIEYPESKLFLLDIVYNQMDFAKYEYDQMVDIANQFGLTHKEKAFEIATWQEFYDWYYDILEEDYEYNGRKIEGFVIEDSVGYMTKLKLTYYNFWKFMRSISHEAIRNGYIKKTSALVTPLANEYYAWVRKLHDVEDKESIPKDICTLRKMFYKEKVNYEY